MMNVQSRSRFLLALFGAIGALSLAAPAMAEDAKAAPAAAPIALMDKDLTSIARPDTAKVADMGDPSGDGSVTGTAADVTMADAKKGITLADLANQAGQNKIAINFVWT